MKRLTYEAGIRGRDVSAHAHSQKAIESAMAAGVRVIEHCSWLDPEGAGDYRADQAERMAEIGIAVCPALGRGYSLPAEQAAPLPERVAFWRHFQNWRFETVKKMFSAGISIVAGTDAGTKNNPFSQLPHTLVMMHQKIGLPAQYVLHAATGLAARYVNLENSIGTIAPGKTADLLMVNGDPLKDLSCLLKPCLLLKEGRVILGEIDFKTDWKK
jgi:imidazolonepropionase-like amidohydrolase